MPHGKGSSDAELFRCHHKGFPADRIQLRRISDPVGHRSGAFRIHGRTHDIVGRRQALLPEVRAVQERAVFDVIVRIPHQVIKDHHVPQLHTVRNRVRGILLQHIKHAEKIVLPRLFILIDGPDSQGLGEVLLVKTHGHGHGIRILGHFPKNAVISPGREQDILVLSAPGIDDKAFRHIQSRVGRRAQGQLFIQHDVFQPHMALLHDVSARRRPRGEVPGILFFSVIEAHLPRCPGQREMGLLQDFRRPGCALRGQRPDLLHGKLPVFRLRRYRGLLHDLDGSQALPSQRVQN